MEFAQRLATIMGSTDTTMYRLAKDIGIHPTTVKNWLSGEYEPKLEMLQKLAEYFNVSYSALLGDIGPDCNVLRKGPYEFSDDGKNGLTLISIGPNMRRGVLYLPDKLLDTFAHLSRRAIEEVCEVAEGLSKLEECQRDIPSLDYMDPNPPDPPYDLLQEDWEDYLPSNVNRDQVEKPVFDGYDKDLTDSPFGTSKE